VKYHPRNATDKKQAVAADGMVPDGSAVLAESESR
jgi:hypothetical protein